MAKKCFVPNCKNRSSNCNKLFLSIPRAWEKRKLWYAAVGKNRVPKGGGRYYCCQDHFDGPNDVLNFRELQLVGGTRCQLREGVVPHQHLGPLVEEPGERTKRNINETSVAGPFEIADQSAYADTMKEGIIEYEFIEFERYSDSPPKIDPKNMQIFPKTIKQEFENSSDVKETYVSDIKQEVSEYIQPKTESKANELLTSHCDLPTLKIESTDYPSYL